VISNRLNENTKPHLSIGEMGFRILTYALPLFQGGEKNLIVKVPGQDKVELTAGKRGSDIRKETRMRIVS